MSAESILVSYEEEAKENLTLTDEQVTSGGVVYSGKGRGGNKQKKRGSKLKNISALGFVVIALVIFVAFFSFGNLIPAAISNRLLEETDVQYADAILSKEIVFQEALREGDIPDNTTELLESNGVIVGYLDEGGNFIKGNRHEGGLVLQEGDNIVTADEFIDEVNNNVTLYDAFNKATYVRAAYWYDDSAKEVMKSYGTNRNNYSHGEEFDEVMESKLKGGNEISINNMQEIKEEVDNGDGTTSVEIRDVNLESLRTTENAEDFVNNVSNQNKDINSNQATLNAADEMKVADTISNEHRSGLFYLLFMENISKMQAGDGNTSRINEAMNYLYTESTNTIVDVKTGETIQVTGTALDSPSMYAILSNEELNMGAIGNYSNDRILKTVENKLNEKNSTINNTITSTDKNVKGVVGRLFRIGDKIADQQVLSSVTPTVSSSLVKNDYNSIDGIVAGEMLAQGAVNVGKDLAKYSGATAGDSEAVAKYARLTNNVLAMDAAVDRLNRNPFDITSKHTFLGSILFSVTISMRYNSNSGILSGVANIASIMSNSINSLLFGTTFADNNTGYLTNYGDCETISTIGAMGSPQCSMIATFDTSTLDDPLHNADYLGFVQNNTEDGKLVKNNTKLANFIKNSIRRTTPVGITDGSILINGVNNVNSNESVPFLSNISDAIIGWFNNTFNTEVKRAATGELFVNSRNNEDWNEYKWAQRYVSLARAQEALRSYAINYDGRMAYNISTLEGDSNPIIAFIREYCDDTIVANE